MAKLFFIAFIMAALTYVAFNTSLEISVAQTERQARYEASLNFK